MDAVSAIHKPGWEDGGAGRVRARPAGEIIMSLMIFRRTFNVRVSITIFGI